MTWEKRLGPSWGGGCWETDKGRALGRVGEGVGDPRGLMSPNPSEEAGLMAGARRCRHPKPGHWVQPHGGH